MEQTIGGGATVGGVGETACVVAGAVPVAGAGIFSTTFGVYVVSSMNLTPASEIMTGNPDSIFVNSDAPHRFASQHDASQHLATQR
jgi:hypothetical protein